MSKLCVELYGILLGTLEQTSRGLHFSFDQGALDHYPLGSTIMSISAPLSIKSTLQLNRRCENFFSELLPEGRNLQWIMQSLPRESRNTYGVLRNYGKDSAGALIIYDPSDPVSSKKPRAEKINDSQIRYLLEHMPQEPLANAPVSGKTSLGGVQGKIVLIRKNDLWYRAHYGYPSTHILKPVTEEYPTMIYDEEFCMALAHQAGLAVPDIRIENFDGADALVIERYDRDIGIAGGRLHQEDFNQALGASGNQKYQEYGGKISAKTIARTLGRFGQPDDVEAFASQLIFAVAIGNLDMHAKNISIFHYPDSSIALTPTYDQVPLRHQPTDGRMALSLRGEYIHANISMEHIVSELLSWKCNRFDSESTTCEFVKDLLVCCLDCLENITLSSKAYPLLRESISLFVTRLLAGKPVGKLP